MKSNDLKTKTKKKCTEIRISSDKSIQRNRDMRKTKNRKIEIYGDRSMRKLDDMKTKKS